MKKLNAFFYTVLTVSVFALTAGPVSAVNVSKQELERMEKQVQQQNMEHKKLQAQATQINMELGEVSRDMVKTAKQIQNNEEKISNMESQLKQLQADLDAANEGFLSQDENLIKTLSALQNLALKPTEALFVQPLTPVETIRSAILLRETVPYLEANAKKIRIELENIEKKKNLVEKQVAKITAQKQILEKEHENMKLLVQKKSRIRNKIEIQTVKAKQKVEKLASQANDLRDLLSKLENEKRLKAKKQEEERKRLAKLREEEERRLAEEKKVEQTQTADLIKYSPEIITEIGKGFVKAKGRLPMPARGPIITTYGEEKIKGVVSKGIIIKTRNMAQVTSPFDGSVIFAGPFRGYGNLIIVDHGEGYLTLMAGLEDIDCELGQMLLAGEPVGQMPDNREAKLYVELRHNNQPIDPMKWYTN